MPDQALDQEDFRKTIMGMLDELSPEQRSATMLYYYSEMSVKQIAQIQGVSEGTVKSRLNYARKAIKKSVEDYEKKNDVKLHSVALLPLLFWLFAGSQEDMPAGAVPIVVDGVAAETGIVLTVESSSAFGGAALPAKLMGLPVIIKATAVVAVVVLVIACISAAMQQEVPSVEPTVSLQTEQTGSADNITELTNTEPVVTEPMVTSPSVSEPPETEPPVTEPPVTEPTSTEPPVTEPIVTEPPVTEPTTTEPPTEEPPVEEPEIEEPEVTVYYVPEGCTYIMADGTELQPGEAMPESCTDGDQFITENFQYKYGYEYGEGEFYDKEGNFLGVGEGFVYTGIDGWSVIVRDKSLTSYPALLDKINGAPLVSLKATFAECENMTNAPSIPSGVTNMEEAFFCCYRLIAAPTIPKGVTNMSTTFAECTALLTAPTIPSSVTKMWGTFAWCSALTGNIQINAVLSDSLGSCFAGTVNPITLTGSCDKLNELAATSENGNVTVA